MVNVLRLSISIFNKNRYKSVEKLWYFNSLNCPCHLYGSIGCTIEPHFIWYIQKYMLIWRICFHFSFVFAICSTKMKTRHVTRDLFMENVVSRRDNFNSRHLFHTMTELSLLCIFVIRNLLRIFILIDALNNFLTS